MILLIVLITILYYRQYIGKVNFMKTIINENFKSSRLKT